MRQRERKERRKEGEAQKKVERRREQERGICIAGRAARMEGKSVAVESIRPLSGVLVSRLPVALRIFATHRQLMDPARRLYTHEINTQAWTVAVCSPSLQHTAAPMSLYCDGNLSPRLLKWRAHQAGKATPTSVM